MMENTGVTPAFPVMAATTAPDPCSGRRLIRAVVVPSARGLLSAADG
ncbi:hypothetical protein BJ982_004321 [Sphaerisporangium siamense]|uniref:Uncharacterized protein n=1 Tax=Sphaerisporangium siamense TaxID=795645 RepID=A0A7W7D9L0_9ACTN|nr:hypothetical protein [Sphaerisporangium siamense]